MSTMKKVLNSVFHIGLCTTASAQWLPLQVAQFVEGTLA